jgi:CubicO group peptidase (beta-lactamase class C family)
MHTYLRFILVAWLTLSCATVGATADLGARIDAFVAPLFKSDQPGATVIATKNGKTVFRKAYGMADLRMQRALDPETPMRLGSVTKQFTAAAILLLAEQGKLSLSDDFRKYLPDFPDKGHVITIEHLLTHTSGISSYTDRPGYAAGMTDELTIAQMVATFKDSPLLFAPAERFAYSNSGYFLLGAIIEKVSGMRYADFLSKQIFEPLDMRRTAYEGDDREPPGMARGYHRTGESFVPAPPLSMSQPFAAGALVSTVDDLARWDEAITSGKLLRPAMWRRAFTPYLLRDGSSTGYGYGWGMGVLKGHPSAAHGGGINGFSAFVLRLPDDKVYVAVLANSDSGLPSTDMSSPAKVI